MRSIKLTGGPIYDIIEEMVEMCPEWGNGMSLMHEFVQITPVMGVQLRQSEDAVDYGYCQEPPQGMTTFRLHDDVIGRNSGRIDGQRTDDWSGMAVFEPGKMRYFSGFTGVTGGQQHAGLNVHGITLLDEAALQYLTAPVGQVGAIAPEDKLIISRFRRFVEETLAAGLWLVHFGI